MKKCPECGNPSYDGAPVCGNCGYKFPKPKVKALKEENIFKKNNKTPKNSNEESTLEIIKENKIIIGTIILITLIVIGIIIVTHSTTNTSSSIDGLKKYSEDNFSFTYPSSWSEVNKTDDLHASAIFFKDNNDVEIEYYNVTIGYSSINEVNNERVNNALSNGDYINTVQQIQKKKKNVSNVIVENYDGGYTRFVSLLNNGNLYVFKITGNSTEAITSEGIESALQSAAIT